MSTRWERLAGDTGAFALKLAFARDPDDGQAADPDVSLTWGGFQLWVEGRNLCAHREAGERIESVHWRLLPLIEWFVAHWNPLLHEERLPAQNLGDTAWESLRATRFPPPAIENDDLQAGWEDAWRSWWMRHALRAASDGGLFPDVVVRRLRDLVEISWGQTRAAGMPEHVDFAESASGFSRLPAAAVADPLHEVLAGASEHLLSRAPASERFRKLRKRIAALRTGERHRERRLMWLAGLGTNEQTVHAGWRRVKRYLSTCADLPRRAMLEASASPLVVTGSCQASLMFGSLAPNVGRADVLALADVMVALHDSGSASQSFESIRGAAPIEDSGDPSWRQGYELAERFHDHFGTFVGDAFVDVDGILRTLGVEVVDRGLSDETVRGVAFDGERHRPGILVNSRNSANEHPFGRRFTLAHELCHLLFDRDAGAQLAMASGPWAPRDVERRANAFAAMVLMPNPLVQRAVAALTGALETADAVGQVAHRLRTGFESTLWHLSNLGYLDDFARQRIAEEARWRPA